MSLFSAACGAAAAAACSTLLRRAGLARPLAAARRGCCSRSRRASGARPTSSASTRSTRSFVVVATAAAFAWHRSARRPHAGRSPSSSAASAPPTTRSWACTPSRWALFACSAHGPGRGSAAGDARLPSRGGGFAAGLLPYLYLPLRSRANPPLDWGNPETLDGVLAVVHAARLLGARAGSKARPISSPIAARLPAQPRQRALLGRARCSRSSGLVAGARRRAGRSCCRCW